MGCLLALFGLFLVGSRDPIASFIGVMLIGMWFLGVFPEHKRSKV